MKQHEIIQKLHSFFSSIKTEPRVDLAYIFGSRAAGKEGPISDCDIAVLCSDSHPFSLRYELSHKLNVLLNTAQVDLVLLNDAPIELRSIEGLEKPRDYYGAIIRLGEASILPLEFSQKLAPIAGFRNILVYDYLDIDRNEVYNNLQQLNDISRFMKQVKNWMKQKISSG